MNKKELIEKVSILSNMPFKKVKFILEEMLDTIVRGLKEDKIVRIYGFGTFKLLDKKRKIIKFKPGKKFKLEILTSDILNKDRILEPEFETKK